MMNDEFVPQEQLVGGNKREIYLVPLGRLVKDE